MAAAEVLAIDDNSLFTDPLPDSSTNANPNANIFFSYYTLLEPSFVDKSSSLIPVPPDLIGSGDIFINSSDDPSVGELDLLSENFDPELLASTRTSSESPPNDCAAVPPFQSRRRRKRDNAQPLQCPASEIGTGTGDDAKPYFRDFRELARQSPQKVSNFDKKNCGGILPYLVCSSNDPFYTIYRPGLLSWVLYESSRGMLYMFFFLTLIPLSFGVDAKQSKIRKQEGFGI